MGIIVRTITEYECDVCGAMCYEPKPHKMITHEGDDETSASYVYVDVKYFNPRFGIRSQTESVVCNECRKDYLKKYLAILEK